MTLKEAKARLAKYTVVKRYPYMTADGKHVDYSRVRYDVYPRGFHTRLFHIEKEAHSHAFDFERFMDAALKLGRLD